MQQAELSGSDDLMALWRATGGALGARSLEAGDGDDGLAAAMHTHGLQAYCATDDGLTAAMYTNAPPGFPPGC